jgi:hypothetical protein
MSMCHFTRPFLSLIGISAFALASAACASHPAPPPAAPTAPPAAAFKQAAGGVTEAQPSPDDDVVFVEKEHKDPKTYGDSAPPATLQPEKSARPQPLQY